MNYFKVIEWSVEELIVNLCAAAGFMERIVFRPVHKLVLFALEVKWCDNVNFNSETPVRQDPERVSSAGQKKWAN